MVWKGRQRACAVKGPLERHISIFGQTQRPVGFPGRGAAGFYEARQRFLIKSCFL